MVLDRSLPQEIGEITRRLRTRTIPRPTVTDVVTRSLRTTNLRNIISRVGGASSVLALVPQLQLEITTQAIREIVRTRIEEGQEQENNELDECKLLDSPCIGKGAWRWDRQLKPRDIITGWYNAMLKQLIESGVYNPGFERDNRVRELALVHWFRLMEGYVETIEILLELGSIVSKPPAKCKRYFTRLGVINRTIGRERGEVIFDPADEENE